MLVPDRTHCYLSSSSANALISELRPTTLAQPALDHINQLLDELLCSLVTSSSSLNPNHLRLHGIPSVFSSDKTEGSGQSTGLRALGRSAVGEAELELRSWYEGHPESKGSNGGFQPDGKGRGMVEGKEKVHAVFPVEEALGVMRIKCVAFSVRFR
jgi:hypothetical protein